VFNHYIHLEYTKYK